MRTIALSVVLLLGAASGAWAQSLLKDDASPYDPPKKPALKKHDHVQIQFQDHAKGAAEPDRKTRWDKELKEWVRFDGKEAPASALTVTAEVIDIRPNGTLVLQAIKRRMVNKDEETLRLTGEIAPAGVTMNKASSENLANLAISYEGPAADAARPGFLGWIFGKIWPF
jgi:flagellar basal body L-ring protein FlgH